MAILVSKYDHCLVDLLYRHKSGELTCDIPLIISNHPDNQPIGGLLQDSVFCGSGSQRQQAASGRKDSGLLRQHNPDFLVLARYMQILSNEFRR